MKVTQLYLLFSKNCIFNILHFSCLVYFKQSPVFMLLYVEFMLRFHFSHNYYRKTCNYMKNLLYFICMSVCHHICMYITCMPSAYLNQRKLLGSMEQELALGEVGCHVTFEPNLDLLQEHIRNWLSPAHIFFVFNLKSCFSTFKHTVFF